MFRFRGQAKKERREAAAGTVAMDTAGAVAVATAVAISSPDSMRFPDSKCANVLIRGARGSVVKVQAPSL